MFPITLQFRKPFHRRARADDLPSSPSPEDDVITGTFLPYGGASVPSGYLDCDGAAVSRTTYAALFAILGTAYGSGDGATTFNVPDFRGRSVLGAGTGPDLSPRQRGDTGGAETHVLSTDEMPAHGHEYIRAEAIDTMSTEVQSGMGGSCLSSVSLQNAYATTAPAGGGQALSLMQPFGVAKWIVKT